MLAGGDVKTTGQKVNATMTATTRGTMRPNGRSPPFLAIGLFIALCVLGFNYWSLSAKNAEQANEISILNSEKMTARASAEKKIDTLSGQVQSLQRDLNTAKQAKDSEALKFRDEKQAMEDQCQREKTTVREELSECQELSNELKTKVDNFRCDAQQCKSLTESAREQVLQDIYRVAGIATMLKLRQADIDLGRLGDQLKEEFSTEIQRQEQLAKLQQQQQQPNEQNIAANQQGLQHDKLPVQQGHQKTGADAISNLLPQQPSNLLQNPALMQARPAEAQVIRDQVNRGTFFQNIIGIQPGEGVQKEAGIQNEAAGGQKEGGILGSTGGQLQDKEGDDGNNSQHVLPKPADETLGDLLGHAGREGASKADKEENNELPDDEDDDVGDGEADEEDEENNIDEEEKQIDETHREMEIQH